MRKIFITLLFGVLFCASHINAQFTVSMSSALVDRDANANVDVTIAGFNNLRGIQFSINYDSTVLEFVSFSNITNLLTDIDVTGTNFKKGEIVCIWTDAEGKSLPDGTRLFTINFKAIGSEGSSSDVVLSNKPRKVEVFDLNYKELTVNSNKGTVTIKGQSNNTCVDPPCTNPNSFRLEGGSVNVKKGNNICVPITVKNFISMENGQGALKWDPAILSYTNVKFPTTGGIPGYGKPNDYNDNEADQGLFIYLWFGDTLTLPDNTVIMELCFDAVGNVGQVGCVQMTDEGKTTLWERENVGLVPLCFTYGKVTITDTDPGAPVEFNTGSASGKAGDIVCVDVSVRNFSDIFSFETKYVWNPAQLRFVRTEGYNLDGLNSGRFNSLNNSLNVAWTDQNGQSKPDNHVIFKMCFELLCPDDNNYIADITVPGPSEVGGKINGEGSIVKLPISFTGGSINVTCDGTNPINPTCATGAIVQTSCNGSSDGSAAMTVTNGNTCDYQWINASGTVIKSGAISGGNLTLTGVRAGSYTFNVICSGNVSTSCTATIAEPTVITIPTNNVVIHESCGNKGSINITSTLGGNGGYTYAWTPELGNTANPTNLSAGTYIVTVTDSKGCTASQSFVVTDAISPLTVSLAISQLKCNGDANGAVQVVATGGCPPYTYDWTGGLSGDNPQGLRAGTYSVTVADSSNPAHTDVKSVTITEPAVISISSTDIKKTTSDSSTDGEITISISGGTPGYTTSWSSGLQGGSTNGTQTVSNVGIGTYSVTVTDANNCTRVLNNIVMTSSAAPDEIPAIGSVNISSNFNGFGVSCFGDNNGEISGTVASGTFPMTVTLRAGSQQIGSAITINTPDFKFSNLIAGTNYSVMVMNSAGTATSSTVVVTQPTKLAATIKSNCSQEDNDTGSIEINMNNTGAGNYSYFWQEVIDFDNKIENVGIGTYNLTVTDANNCELRLSNMEVKACDNNGGCFEASSIITPNGDNINDLFIINCAQDNPADLNVFDRWGRLVYSQINYDNTWQGIDDDRKDLKEGGYIWVLTVNFGQGRKEIYKGTVTLLRGSR